MAEPQLEDGYLVDTNAYRDLIGEAYFNLVLSKSPPVVMYRVAKSVDHCNKAKKLIGVDEEMGAIRLIAAEEELVVAIFRWLEANEAVFPDAGGFLKKYKDHRVKLAFTPVLSQFEYALSHLGQEGFTAEGLEDHLHWRSSPAIVDGKVVFQITDNAGQEIITHDPLMISVTREGLTPEQVVEALLADFEKTVLDQQGVDLKTFVTQRASYRDLLLYAYDAVPLYVMNESLEELFAIVEVALKRLLFVLAVLLNGDPPGKDWGVVAQFYALYRKVLVACEIIKAPKAAMVVEAPDSHYQFAVKER